MNEKNEVEKFKKKYEKLMAAHEGLKLRINRFRAMGLCKIDF